MTAVKTKTGSEEPEESPEEARRRRMREQTEIARRAALGRGKPLERG